MFVVCSHSSALPFIPALFGGRVFYNCAYINDTGSLLQQDKAGTGRSHLEASVC